MRTCWTGSFGTWTVTSPPWPSVVLKTCFHCWPSVDTSTRYAVAWAFSQCSRIVLTSQRLPRSTMNHCGSLNWLLHLLSRSPSTALAATQARPSTLEAVAWAPRARLRPAVLTAAPPGGGLDLAGFAAGALARGDAPGAAGATVAAGPAADADRAGAVSLPTPADAPSAGAVMRMVGAAAGAGAVCGAAGAARSWDHHSPPATRIEAATAAGSTRECHGRTAPAGSAAVTPPAGAGGATGAGAGAGVGAGPGLTPPTRPLRCRGMPVASARELRGRLTGGAAA